MAYPQPMRITAVDTIQLGQFPNFFFVEIHTDEGLVGLGQTADSRRTAPVVQELGELLLGRDPLGVEPIWNDLFRRVSFHGYAGAEMRAISAIDIALWDLLGQATGRPIWQLLGGLSRERVPIYNTNSRFGDRNDAALARTDPIALAEQLLANGIKAMKWSMIDEHAAPSLGHYLEPAQVAAALASARKLADRFGDSFRVGVEGHSVLDLPAAVQFAHAAEELPNILWLEDMLPPENPRAWAELKRQTRLPVAGSERFMSRWQFVPLFEGYAVDVAIADVTWAGGISELKKLAVMAEAYHIPITPHDHSGPVNLLAGTHVMCNVPNASVMETSRVFYETYYADLVDHPPVVKDGHVHAPTGPGLGAALLPDVRKRGDATVTKVA